MLAVYVFAHMHIHTNTPSFSYLHYLFQLYIVLLGGESGEISWDRYLRRVSAAGRRATVADISLLTPNITIATTTAHERAVLHMAKMGRI